MIKITLLTTSFKLFSRETYFVVENNFIKYAYKSTGGDVVTPLQSGSVSTFEMGYSLPLKIKETYYSFGLAIDDYNAATGSSSESYNWDVKYIGIQNVVSYKYAVSKDFQVTAKVGLNLSTMIYGKQNTNRSVYDLMGQNEFAGILILPFVGLQTRYKLNELGCLSLGCAFSKSLKPFDNAKEKSSFNTNQLLFGIHFNINKK